MPGCASHGMDVLPAVAFIEPKETPAVLDPMPVFDHLGPGIVPVGEERLKSAVPDIAPGDEVGVLKPLEVLKDHVPPILRPFNPRGVVVPRIGAWAKPARLAATGSDHAHAACGVGLMGAR